MRQNELEKRLARKAGLSPGAARDEVDEVVRRVLMSLREGKPAELPGVGLLCPVTSAAKSTGRGGSKAVCK